uniref:Putative peptidase family m13 includes neprilysin n=1 Tax=Amblyomma triste TaxID=251400 RepID=A0A023G785_AMBTT
MSVLERRYQHIPNIPLGTSFLEVLAMFQKNRKLNDLMKWKGGETKDEITVIRKDLKYCDHKHTSTPNHFVFPMEFFQEPFFANGLPWSVNFGSFGSVFAHQLLHHLHLGVHRSTEDKYLLLVNSCDKFSKNDVSACTKSTQCLFDEYKDAIQPVYNRTVETYLGSVRKELKEAAAKYYYENFPFALDRSMPGYIGDNSGISIVIEAYKKLLTEECDKEETRLKDLEDYSGMQLLLLARSMALCGAMAEDQMHIWMTDKQHSPYKHRVNIPMKNNADFADAFKCKKGSEMYKEENERCKLW